MRTRSASRVTDEVAGALAPHGVSLYTEDVGLAQVIARANESTVALPLALALFPGVLVVRLHEIQSDVQIVRSGAHLDPSFDEEVGLVIAFSPSGLSSMSSANIFFDLIIHVYVVIIHVHVLVHV